MADLSLDGYRKEWPRIGAVLGMAVVGATALGGDRLGRRRQLAALNFAALLVHQFEEYVEPGWFPGQLNKGMFRSESPRNYPLNANTAMVINTVIAYPAYIAPIAFPRPKALGLGPVLFGMSQAVAHGILFPVRAGDRYSPGFLTAAMLHVPIGVAYIRALRREDGGTSRRDLAAGLGLALMLAAVAVIGPNSLGRDRASRHAFTRKQMGRYEGPEG